MGRAWFGPPALLCRRRGHFASANERPGLLGRRVRAIAGLPRHRKVQRAQLRRCTDGDGVRPGGDTTVLKPDDNPPSLTPGAETPAALEGQWWVAHTKARNEKALAWDLFHHGIGYFLPMREYVFFSGGRKRRGMMPLFTSYVFFCGDDQARRLALATNRVCQTLNVANQQLLINELAVIQQALAASADLEPYAGAAVGQRCRVKAGPFEGLEGVVVERHTRARLVLNVDLVRRYLGRDRVAMATLKQLRDIVPHVADAMARKDLPAFGKLVDEVWRLNKQLDPGSTNEAIEVLLERVRPYVHGAKLLGAGGGGFLLMVCKSPQDAAAVRRMLEAEPPNERARFFEFDVSREGLVVTVC